MSFVLASLFDLQAQLFYTPSAENIEARETFANGKLGIFIHWGLYSLLGQGEWVMQNQNIHYLEYARLSRSFYPSAFDAGAWVKAIKASGARYICFTSRHHDGFSLFDSRASDYNVVKATPFARDIVGEMAQACREQGIPLHLYYSLLDWGRLDYYPPGRTGTGTGRFETAGREGRWEDYIAFMEAQLTELLTRYGPVGAIWLDGLWDRDQEENGLKAETWHLYELYALIHRLMPACLIGNNHHMEPFAGEDIQIFERDIPGQNQYGYSNQAISALPLETCQTMNRSWGYRISDTDYKSPETLIRLLVQTAGKGANLLLNIGPRPDGTLPEEALFRLQKMGEWLKLYGPTIYDTRGGCIPARDWGVTTQKDKTLFVHLLDHQEEAVFLPIKSNKLLKAQVFIDRSPVEFSQNAEGILLLPPAQGNREKPLDVVLELRFKDRL